ncbi:hypothetical protein FQR65_LT05838 [Abscondita terminalis]|nr:hypothetical protein FQR65_LT05838 [Abscondita terminalis]
MEQRVNADLIWGETKVLFTCYSKQYGLINVKTVRELINQTTCVETTAKAGISLPLTELTPNLHAQTVSQINPHHAASFSIHVYCRGKREKDPTDVNLLLNPGGATSLGLFGFSNSAVTVRTIEWSTCSATSRSVACCVAFRRILAGVDF